MQCLARAGGFSYTGESRSRRLPVLGYLQEFNPIMSTATGESERTILFPARGMIEPLTFYLRLLFDVSEKAKGGGRYLFHFRPGRLQTSE